MISLCLSIEYVSLADFSIAARLQMALRCAASKKQWGHEHRHRGQASTPTKLFNVAHHVNSRVGADSCAGKQTFNFACKPPLPICDFSQTLDPPLRRILTLVPSMSNRPPDSFRSARPTNGASTSAPASRSPSSSSPARPRRTALSSRRATSTSSPAPCAASC